MTNSRQLARLIGPTIVALGVTEALNLDMFAHQIAPVVYLDGTILFVAGLALVGAHNRWNWSWTLLVTQQCDGGFSEGITDCRGQFWPQGWCERRESNPHRHFGRTDFKSSRVDTEGLPLATICYDFQALSSRSIKMIYGVLRPTTGQYGGALLSW
jgi:hypothetical protein